MGLQEGWGGFFGSVVGPGPYLLPADPCPCPQPPLVPPGACINANIEVMEKESALNPRSWFFLKRNVENHARWDYKRQEGQYEDFGNFNFGAVAAAMGVPLYVSQNGAGIYQQTKGAARAGSGFPVIIFSYGDDEKDANQIERGYMYVKCECNKR